jgi:hypothetical protein
LSVISSRKIGLTKSGVLPIAILACGITFFLGSPVMAEDTLPTKTEQVEEEAGFAGMDEAVNERLAEEAGRPAQDPYLNTESMGDLWNALLLTAGGVCGFILGRGWDKVFVNKSRSKSDPTHAMKPLPVSGK